MTSINPQISLKKEKFLYGVDLHIEGTILLPGVDISTLKTIEIKHIVKYGISYDAENPTEDFSNSRKVEIGIFPVDTNSLTFSIPIVYPNIKKTDGTTFDEYFSLIQNIFILTVSEKSFFSISHETIITPIIEWVALTNPEIQFLKKNEEDKEEDTKDVIDESKEDLDIVLERFFPDSIKLPWSLLDFVSKEYYNGIISSSFLAKLGDMFYRNKFYVGMRKIGYMALLLSLIAIIIIKDTPGLFLYPFISILFFGIYLCLEYVPRWYLQKRMDIGKYAPKIQNTKIIQEGLKTGNLTTKSLFIPYQEGFQNPLTSVEGTLSITLSLNHKFEYQSGKHTNTHNQFLLNGTIASIEFNSLEQALTDNKIILTNWANEIINIQKSSTIGLKKELSISITYLTLPDIDYTIHLS